MAGRELEKRKLAQAEREAERKAMEAVLAAEEAKRPPAPAPLTSNDSGESRSMSSEPFNLPLFLGAVMSSLPYSVCIVVLLLYVP